jgi:hypothetical protein
MRDSRRTARHALNFLKDEDDDEDEETATDTANAQQRGSRIRTDRFPRHEEKPTNFASKQKKKEKMLMPKMSWQSFLSITSSSLPPTTTRAAAAAAATANCSVSFAPTPRLAAARNFTRKI